MAHGDCCAKGSRCSVSPPVPPGPARLTYPPNQPKPSRQAPAELVLRAASPFNFCVIDEVDSILIDEARTPLIISGTSDAPSDKYGKAARIAEALSRDLHYTARPSLPSELLASPRAPALAAAARALFLATPFPPPPPHQL